jgi:putative transposase
VRANDTICHERLQPAGMAQHHHLAHQAACAGRRCVAVNPAYTSQDCSGCRRRRQLLTLPDRAYACSCCGLVLNRDRKASLNILRVGQQLLASA